MYIIQKIKYGKNHLIKRHSIKHTLCAFASAIATPKMNKEYVLPTLYILLKTNNYTLKVRKPVTKKCKRNCGFCA